MVPLIESTAELNNDLIEDDNSDGLALVLLK